MEGKHITITTQLFSVLSFLDHARRVSWGWGDSSVDKMDVLLALSSMFDPWNPSKIPGTLTS